MKILYRFPVLAAMATALAASAGNFINVSPYEGDATAALQKAIEAAAEFKGKPVTIRLAQGNYNISRAEASEFPYHISNTASVDENPDCTKHIGLWFRNLKNVTFDGNGASIVTHGEMTPIAIDSCDGVTLRNFTLTAADPTVPELKILSVERNSLTAEVVAPSQFEVTPEGEFYFTGEGWRYPDPSHPEYGRLTQVFYPDINVTNRCGHLLDGLTTARRLGDRIVQLFYNRMPDVHVGESFQLRHGIRSEVCAFISLSKNITFENLELNFLGNFGLVGQFTETITYDNIRCRPALGSGRTDAGFADFVQMSGCSGKLTVRNSWFEGAHDDPINIHGTHLRGVETDGKKQLTVRFMHNQTFGFQPFFKGDEVDIVDRHTLNILSSARLTDVKKLNDYDFALTLSGNLPELPEGYTVDDIAVENVTRTPEVEITGNYFARTPTRGVLITTRRKALIQDNIFFRIPMPAILVSNDARGWYESGPVRDLTIRRNTFIECGSPVIDINPEIDRFNKAVHSGIRIEDNRFIMKEGTKAVRLSATSDVKISGNLFEFPKGITAPSVDSLVEQVNSTDVIIDHNIVSQ